MNSLSAILFRSLLSLLLLSVALISVRAAAFASDQAKQKSDTQTTEQAATTWLQRAALPLKSQMAGSGFEDLQPLKAVLKDVRIVGLGEATHGTREFFQVKHRFVEFLVRELGFTLFAMEAQYMNCRPINDYVLGRSLPAATANPAQLLRANLAGIWQTEEVLALVNWMRAYNQTVPSERQVRFHGFDVQTPHRAAEALQAYLKQVAPEYALAAQKIIKETAPGDYRKFWVAYAKRSVAQKARLRARLLQLIGYLATNQTRLIRLSSSAEFEMALQAARILLQSDQIRSTADEAQGTNENRRDQYMAETVEYLLQRENPNAKIILWAHNFHLWKFQPHSDPLLNHAVRDTLKHHGLLFKPMGSYLREVFGTAYYAFGFVFDQGSFQAVAAEAGAEAMEPEAFTLGPSPTGSGGWYLSRAGLGDFILDLRAEPDAAEAAQWLASPQWFRFAGAEFSHKWTEKEFALPIIPRQHFDGLIFIAKTARARPL